MLEFKNFRRKPVIMKAVQLTEDVWYKIKGLPKNALEVRGFIVKAVLQQEDYILGTDANGNYKMEHTEIKCFLINTLEDVDKNTLHKARVNDWLVQGVNGEIWAVKPDIFLKTYEEV